MRKRTGADLMQRLEGRVQSDAEFVAQGFHDYYEKLAPQHSYRTRKESAVRWEDVPEPNKALMIDVAQSLLDDGWIVCGRDRR